MARTRITDADIQSVYKDVARLMVDDLHLNMPILYLGSHENAITNKLYQTTGLTTPTGGSNLWPDGMAGTTRRDAYNALRVMRSSLAAVSGAPGGSPEDACYVRWPAVIDPSLTPEPITLDQQAINLRLAIEARQQKMKKAEESIAYAIKMRAKAEAELTYHSQVIAVLQKECHRLETK